MPATPGYATFLRSCAAVEALGRDFIATGARHRQALIAAATAPADGRAAADEEERQAGEAFAAVREHHLEAAGRLEAEAQRLDARWLARRGEGPRVARRVLREIGTAKATKDRALLPVARWCQRQGDAAGGLDEAAGSVN